MATLATDNSRMENWKLVYNNKDRRGQRRASQQTRRIEQRQSNLFANNFSALRTIEEPNQLAGQSQQTKPTPLITKPPPIVVDLQHNIKQVQDMLTSSSIRFKQMQTGTKIFPSSTEEHSQILSSLKEKDFRFYTHRSKDERRFKVFLYGLPKLQIKEIMEDLQSKNLIPTDLKEIVTKVSTDSNAAYSMLFKKSSVSLRDLKKVQFICRTRVSWRQYNAKTRNSPTICWKCLMYGHGGDNCFRPPACMICASNEHIRENCPNIKEETKFQCFNCIRNKRPANHRANDIQCPSRAEFLNIRQNMQNRNNRSGPTRYTNTPTDFSTAVFNPLFSQPSSSNALPPKSVTYADVLKEDLFSIEELFKIFQTSLTKLRQCTSKDQQIAVIASLLQYAV